MLPYWVNSLLNGLSHKWSFSWTWNFGWTGYKQMKILVTRLDVTDKGVFGHLTLDSNPFNCVTLENHIKLIKEGRYKLIIDHSPHLGYDTPHIIDPVRDGLAGGDAGIRIHILNWEYQSEGCIGVGMKRDGVAIEQSKTAFNSLMQVLKGCNDIEITIK